MPSRALPCIDVAKAQAQDTGADGEVEIERDPAEAEASRRHAELTELLNEARWRYHVLDAPTISDGEFDAGMRELNAIEDAYPSLRTPDSPTQQVGGPPSTTFAPVEHLQRLMSLDNVFSREELERWAAPGRPRAGGEADRPVGLPVRAEGRRAGAGPGLRAGPAGPGRHPGRRPGR